MKKLTQMTFTLLFIMNTLFLPTATFAQTREQEAVEELQLKDELSRLQEKTNFRILIPSNYSKWNLILKPLSLNKDQIHILITFEDKKNKGKYIFDCIQQSATDNSLRKGEDVKINHYPGKFTPWAKSRNNPKPVGGILKWVQKDTSIEMTSSHLTKNEMIKIAQKMR